MFFLFTFKMEKHNKRGLYVRCDDWKYNIEG